jgi:HEAT repeat protein
MKPESPSPEHIPFSKVLEALQDTDNPVGGRIMLRLSDLEPDELHALEPVWSILPDWRRVAIMQEADDLSSSDTLLSYQALAMLALQDPEPEVRVLALRTLNDYEDRSLIAPLMGLIEHDPSDVVRAAAAASLGSYVYMGELEEIPDDIYQQIQDLLLSVLGSPQSDAVRRAALEAISFSSREDIHPWIEKAFANPDRHWKASALTAMGRSANTDWEPQVLSMLGSNYPLLRMEAARAAGELELREASQTLVEMLDDPDEPTRQAAIWSLSQIGGQGVREILERLLKRADNDAEAEFLEEAIDNLAFADGVQLMPMFDLPKDTHGVDDDEEDDEDWYEEVDPNEVDFYEDLDDELDLDENDEDDEYDDDEDLAD